MIVGISIFELHLPAARSLKQKRKVVRSLVDRIHQRFKVSVIESDHHDLHQRTELAVALVARSDSDAEQLFDAIRRLVDQQLDCVLSYWDPQYLEVSS
ncbi:MAG: DUF503 domain-containing protein [Holophagales bacterium]|nr:DUF503 domain-containing protein [Holophagales bacterium]